MSDMALIEKAVTSQFAASTCPSGRFFAQVDYFCIVRYQGVFTISAFELWQDAERRQAMPYSISTLLTRNLHDVFGENDPARRRAAIDEIFTEDCVFYEPRASTWPR
jgi:hypothetical protein